MRSVKPSKLWSVSYVVEVLPTTTGKFLISDISVVKEVKGHGIPQRDADGWAPEECGHHKSMGTRRLEGTSNYWELDSRELMG